VSGSLPVAPSLTAMIRRCRRADSVPAPALPDGGGPWPNPDAGVVARRAVGHYGQVVRRPDLNGLRVQQYGDSHVYLIDEGRRRLIPNATVMARLFNGGADWSGEDWSYDYHPETGVILDLHVNKIDMGLPLPDECVIFEAADSPQVFLLDSDADGDQVKRWITDEETMERFQFDWDKIKSWNVALDDLALPDGPDISWP
jgi:hypothetical protein